MISFVKEGIAQIKETKKYAREKNVISWMNDLVMAIGVTFMGMSMFVLYSIVFMIPLIENISLFPVIPSYVITAIPICLSALFFLKYGKYPIKLMILKSYYVQKWSLKLLSKLDMYFWRKYGKDSLATYYVTKYHLPVQLIFYAPLFLVYLL